MPANFTSGINNNPWGGNITVAPDTNPAYFDIIFTNVPSAASTTLTNAVSKLTQTAPTYTASTQNMDGCILNKKGVSMLEVAASMVIIVYILSMIIPNNIQCIHNAQFQKTVAEMKAIAQASIDFYISQGACPTGINQLAPTYMPQYRNFQSL